MNYSTRRELSLKAAQRAQHVRLKCKIPQNCAIDPILIAEKRNCEVRFQSLPSLEGVYSPWPKPVIVLGSQRHLGRRSFTCAHELGHHEFKHGMCLEKLKNNQDTKSYFNDPNEFLAEMFAAFLLMPKLCILKLLKTFQIKINSITPLQIFILSAYLGVGYTTFINHLTWTLKLFSQEQAKHLSKVKPKELKSIFGGSPQGEAVIVGSYWTEKTVDLEKDDIVALPVGSHVEKNGCLTFIQKQNNHDLYKASSKGLSRALNGDWAVNIRITSKFYEGLASNRFLDDPMEVLS